MISDRRPGEGEHAGVQKPWKRRRPRRWWLAGTRRTAERPYVDVVSPREKLDVERGSLFPQPIFVKPSALTALRDQHSYHSRSSGDGSRSKRPQPIRAHKSLQGPWLSCSCRSLSIMNDRRDKLVLARSDTLGNAADSAWSRRNS